MTDDTNRAGRLSKPGEGARIKCACANQRLHPVSARSAHLMDGTALLCAFVESRQCNKAWAGTRKLADMLTPVTMVGSPPVAVAGYS
jgi:hypothetical protein